MPEIIVEDGTLVDGANSYVDVIAADIYFSGHPQETEWNAVSDDRKAWALYRAARYIESRYSGRWRGVPVGVVGSLGVGISQLQNLSWPRVIYTDYGYLYGSFLGNLVIPQQLIEAQCELALRDIQQGNLAPDQDRDQFVSSESVGPITTTYQQSAPSKVRFPEIDVILAPLLEGGAGTRPILRG